MNNWCEIMKFESKYKICISNSAFENAVSKMSGILPQCVKVIYKRVLSRLWMWEDSKYQINYFVCHIREIVTYQSHNMHPEKKYI